MSTPTMTVRQLAVAGTMPVSFEVVTGASVVLATPYHAGAVDDSHGAAALAAIAGHAPYIETAVGSVRLDGMELQQAPPRRRAITTVRAEPDLLAHLSLWDNAALALPQRFVLRGRHQRQAAARWRLARLFADVGLAPDHLATRAGRAAAEARWRTTLVRALAPAPRVLLIEHAELALGPGSALDQAAEDLRNLAARHDIAVVATLADAAAGRFAARAGAPIVRMRPVADLRAEPPMPPEPDLVAGRLIGATS